MVNEVPKKSETRTVHYILVDWRQEMQSRMEATS